MHERPLRAEESGARPIDAPLVAGGPSASVHAGPDLANYGPRFGAYVVDVVLVGIAGAVALAAGLAVGGGLGGSVAIGAAVSIVIGVGYFPYFWTRGGQTPGMRVAHLRVVLEEEPGPLTVGTSVKRYIVFVFGAAALYLGFLWVFVDPRRKAWHDIAARTIVVHVSDAMQPAAAATSVAAASGATAGPAADIEPMSEVPPRSSREWWPPRLPGRPTSSRASRCVSVQGLKKHFPIHGGVMRRQIGTVYAVDGVDFEIMPGETFALVGESGLRQDDARPDVDPAHAAHGREGRVRRLRAHRRRPGRHAAAPPADADHLPGPVRVAEPADADLATSSARASSPRA